MDGDVMGIERKYYSEEQQLQKELLATPPSESEGCEARRQKTRDALLKYAAKLQRIERIPNKAKIERFQILTEQADFIARNIYADILCESDDALEGKITFETNILILEEWSWKRIWEMLCQLINSADSVLVYPNGETLRMELWFILCDEKLPDP